ncbi:MAG: DUF969 domain-containing protein [Caulobacteraceae bacterium]
MATWLPLVGVAVVAVGFLLRLNPMLVVLLASLGAGLGAGLPLLKIVAALGHAFNENRYVTLIWLILPVIGLLERHGLQERARQRIARLKVATTGRLLLVYMALRQGTAALGLVALGGQAQMVRPMVAPMAEGAAEARLGPLPEKVRNLVRAHAAAVDNIGVFFGEDIFIAIGSILLIHGVLQGAGVEVDPLRLSTWAAPTAVAALVVHGARLLWLDRKLARQAGESKPAESKPAELGAGAP